MLWESDRWLEQHVKNATPREPQVAEPEEDAEHRGL
jgi:hypothetical protein